MGLPLIVALIQRMKELDLQRKMEENMIETGRKGMAVEREGRILEIEGEIETEIEAGKKERRGGPEAGMRRGREQEEIPVKKKETPEKGEIQAKMIEEEGRGWIRVEMKGEDLEVGTEEKRGTDPEVMKEKEKITEEIEDLEVGTEEKKG